MDNKKYNLITVLTFTYPHEIAIIRGRLESEGIECFVQDEMTIQVNPFYSNAIGGIKLQVKESDLQKAVEILKDGGYIKDSDLQPSKLYTKLDKYTSRLPFVKKLGLEFRLMVIVPIIVALTASIIYFAELPTTYERLTKKIWHLDYVVYNGKNFIPQANEYIKLCESGFCYEIIDFRENGTIKIPGFQSHDIWGEWQLDNGLLQIYNTDTLDYVYNGTYEIYFSNAGLVLKSQKTTLFCHY